MVSELIDVGYDVIAFDNLSHGHRAAVHPAAHFVEADLLDVESLRRCLEEGTDAVVHLAAEALIDESLRDPKKFYSANVVGGLNLLSAMMAAGVKRLVFSSTAAVYGEPLEIPIREDAGCTPVNPYGASKLAFEQALHWYHLAYDLNYVTFRYFNAAGALENRGEAHRPETHLIPMLLEVAKGGLEVFSLYGTDYDTPDGTCVRDYVHVHDIAQAHIQALQQVDSLSAVTLNLGNSRAWTNAEVIDCAKRVTGRDIPVVAAPRRPGDPARLVADSQIARDRLGWEPSFPELESMVASAWAWMQEHEYPAS